jgi:orotate phosphoribosyltransferase
MASEKLVEMLKKAVKRGDFTLTSGKKSDYYIDIKKVSTDPKVLKEIVKEMAGLIAGERVDRIAGVAVGGIPIAAALSLELGVPFLIVRKEKKRYGRESKIEGELSEGDRVIMVEDVTTTGGSVLAAVKGIREKAVCNKVIAVVDRGEGAKALLKEHGIELLSLVKARELM